MARDSLATTAFAKTTVIKKNTTATKAMKPSGVAWLGDIPEGWEVDKAKRFFRQTNTRGNATPTLLAATQKYGMYPQDRLEGVVKVKEETCLQLFKTVHIDDFVISLRSFQGGFAHSSYEGVCSPAYQTFHATKVIWPRFYSYLFKSGNFIQMINSLTVGIREGKNINYCDFAECLMINPPLPEQRTIADYLDEKCGAIDAAVAEAKNGIEEYKAWKKSLIFEAVTGKRRVGIFNAEKQSCREAEKMKHSGIPWIGEIPEGWRVNKGRFIYDIATGKKDVNAEAPDGQYMFFTCSKTAKRIATYSFDCEALLVAGNGEVGFTQYYKGKFDAYQRTYVISGFRGVAPLFLRYYMSGLLPLQAQYNSVGSVIEFIKLGDLKGFVVTLPSLLEQQVIADYLDEKCAAIDAMVAEKEALIADLEAYKKSLIYETVTGKREVG